MLRPLSKFAPRVRELRRVDFPVPGFPISTIFLTGAIVFGSESEKSSYATAAGTAPAASSRKRNGFDLRAVYGQYRKWKVYPAQLHSRSGGRQRAVQERPVTWSRS